MMSQIIIAADSVIEYLLILLYHCVSLCIIAAFIVQVYCILQEKTRDCPVLCSE